MLSPPSKDGKRRAVGSRSQALWVASPPGTVLARWLECRSHTGTPPGKAYKEEPTQMDESQEQKGRGESHPEPGMCPRQVHRNPIIPDPPPVTPVSVTCYPGEVQPSLCLRQPPSLESDENPCSDSLACQKAPHHSPQGRD